MKIYKLTGIDGGDVVLGENHLRPAHIAEIVRVDNDRTRITLRIPGTEAGFSLTDYKTHHYLVKETPADILAMIEAGEASSPGLAAERPRTITVDELLVGDHVVGLPLHDGEGAYHSSDGMRHFFNNIGGRVLSSLEKRTVSALLARGMQVYRDGKLISGWPVGEETSGGDADTVARMLFPQPEPVATPDRPKTITVDELRAGDEVGWEAYRIKIQRVYSDDGQILFQTLHGKYPSVLDHDVAAELFARGVQVYRDGKLISGWPVGEEPSGGNAVRVAELEAEVAKMGCDRVADKSEIMMLCDKILKWKDAASVDLADEGEEPVLRCKTPEELIERLRHLYRWATSMERRVNEEQREHEKKLAAIKSQPKPPESAATPELPKTMTIDELRKGDEIEFHGRRRRVISTDSDFGLEIYPPLTTTSFLDESDILELLPRGMQVYRDGKLISGWPIGGEPDNFDWQSCYRAAEADVKKHEARITELEAEVKSWKDAANSGHLECEEAYVYDAAELLERIDEFERRIKSREATIAELEAELAAAKDRIRAYQNAAFSADYPNPKTPMRLAAELETLQQRIATTAAELAAAKARPVEPPPLDKARVFATAESIALSLVRDSLWDNTNTAAETESRLWSMVQEILKRAKWQLNGHGAKPYKVE